MASLLRLTYASQMAFGPSANISAAISDILAASVRNNGLLGVTGMLVNHAGFFVQALEGPQKAVEATYARVADDRRHKAAKVISREWADDRLFGSWAMCANSISSTDDQILKVLALKGAFDPFRLPPQSALKLLTTVAAIRGSRPSGELQVA